MAFGFTGCHATLPHMQRIAVYTGEAFDELEKLLMVPVAAPKRRRAAPRKAAPRKRAPKPNGAALPTALA
jgi:diacylglycerol O-acyltransferase